MKPSEFHGSCYILLLIPTCFPTNWSCLTSFASFRLAIAMPARGATPKAERPDRAEAARQRRGSRGFGRF